MDDRVRRRAWVAVMLAVIGFGIGPARTADADEWPAKGPQREGRTLVFPHHNLRWTLPEEGGWMWRKPARDESGYGELINARAQMDGHDLWCGMSVQRVERYRNIRSGVNKPEVQRKASEGMLSATDHARTTVAERVPVGNYNACVVRKYGEFRGKPAALCHYETYLHGEGYVFQTLVWGTEESEAVCKEHMDRLLAGIEFIEATPWVVGPCQIEGVVAADRPLGHGLGECTVVERPEVKATKPASMTTVPFDPSGAGATFRFAWEAWSEDKLAYMYFDLRTVDTKSTSKIRKLDEYWIKQRVDILQKGAPEGEFVTRRKKRWFKEKWGRYRGTGYEFRCTYLEHPFTELGYVYKRKKHWYWVRIQYGGKDARERMADLDKALRKCLKY